MGIQLSEVDRVEILTLQDNYIDLASMDGTEMVQRALPLKGLEFSNSIVPTVRLSIPVTNFCRLFRKSFVSPRPKSVWTPEIRQSGIRTDPCACENYRVIRFV